jgi:hypothetical protein
MLVPASMKGDLKRVNERYKQVADLLRTGESTPELEAEYLILESEYRETLKRNPAKQPASLWDLDVTRRCWQGDAREVER